MSTEPQVGQRVRFVSLLLPSEARRDGAVLAISPFSVDTVAVKLDCQELPVGGVLWLAEEPGGAIPTALWQYCWPLYEKDGG